ncbi:MAG: helix-turn-helix transcriptional regulator [Clostridia bacterium]|nr:helix-turn-helix transcriptional regulator [Clostridia bacterium]
MDVGKIISELRTERKMSQQTLADLLYVSRELVSKWETGKRRPDYHMIENISEVFGIPVSRIIDTNDVLFDELSECVPARSEITPEDLAPIVNDFLKGLDVNESSLFIERYYFLRNVTEISLISGKKENYIRAVLSRTRHKLKKYVKEHLL